MSTQLNFYMEVWTLILCSTAGRKLYSYCHIMLEKSSFVMSQNLSYGKL